MLHILGYCTDINHQNISFLKNRLPSLEIINSNEIELSQTFYAKSYYILEKIKTYNKNDYVIVCDLYDVLPLWYTNIDSLYESIKINFDLDKITFNAEVGCYPDCSIANSYPKQNYKWKYLNAGLYFGKVLNIINMLNISIDKIKTEMDQLVFSKLFLSSNLIALDYECRVFQSVYEGTIGGSMNLNDFYIQDNIIYNKYFNTKPLFFHGNGKTNMSKLSPYL
jgi:hypothetical protein